MNVTTSPTSDFFNALSRHISRHAKKINVIKNGGESMEDVTNIRHQMIQAINLSNCGSYVIEVHGGGAKGTIELQKAGIVSEFQGSHRLTSAEAMVVLERTWREMNNNIVRIFKEEADRMNANVTPIGMGGFWNNLIQSKMKFEGTCTGEVVCVNGQLLRDLVERNFVPIIYPACAGLNGQIHNVNADEVAANVAEAVGADRLILCSNVDGVKDKNGVMIPLIYTDQVQGLIDNMTITKGMIVKVQEAARLAESPRIGGVVILNGMDPNAIEKELFTDEGAGTLIQRRPELTV